MDIISCVCQAILHCAHFYTYVARFTQVSAFDDPHEACLSVVAESYRLWLNYETRTDDITMIVLQFSGLDTPQRPPPGSLHRLVDQVSVTRREVSRWGSALDLSTRLVSQVHLHVGTWVHSRIDFFFI
jgi:hypothetical protein